MENGDTIIRFSNPDFRFVSKFIFSLSVMQSVDSIFQFLLNQSFIVPISNDPSSFTINLVTEKEYSIPSNSLSLIQAHTIFAHRSSMEKLQEYGDISTLTSLSLEEYNTYFDEEKRLRDFDKLKADCFSRGINSDVRPKLLLYLFNVFDAAKTQEENILALDKLTNEYEIILQRWNLRIQGQERYSNKFHGVILSDVKRTDRKHPMFADNPYSFKILEEVLVCFTLYESQIGYTQGMNDLVSTLMQIFFTSIDETNAIMYDGSPKSHLEGSSLIFWCFRGLLKLTGHDIIYRNMEIGHSFFSDRVYAILQTYDPPLARWLTSRNQQNLYFTLSPFLLIYRRLFQFDSLMYIWDRVMCSSDPMSYLRLVMSSSLILSFSYILITVTSTSTDLLSSYENSLQEIDVVKLINTTNSLLKRLNEDAMHTGWLLMKYPEPDFVELFKPTLLPIN